MLLPILISVPFVFGVLSWQSERVNARIPRWMALFGTSIIFFIVMCLYLLQSHWCRSSVLINNNKLLTNLSSEWQLEYICAWIPRFGISLHLALDGLSLLMLMLSGILGMIAILSAWNEENRSQGLFYCNLLWILGGVIGVFLSMDMFLLFFFWEMMLIPMYFLISLWGCKDSTSHDRINAATKFFIYTQFSGLVMLISIIGLVLCNYTVNGVWSFNYNDLLYVSLPKHIEYLLMLGFFLAFAIKMPIIPFHSWLPEVHSHTAISGSVDLIGILLKTAVYGFFRFILPLFPSASQDFSLFAMSLGILNIFYGAWMAFMQIDIKRLIAYTNISHMGFVLIAIYSNNQLSYQGAVVQIISYSLSASGMFVLFGQLYERVHTRDISAITGLWNRIDLIPAFSLCFISAMLGIPGTGNFIGEIIILFGTFQTTPIIAIVSSFGILFISICFLIVMQRMYYESTTIKLNLLKNITCREKFISAILILCIFLIGFYPQFILNTSYDTMCNIYSRCKQYS